MRRQPRPLFPIAWTALALADSLGVHRRVILDALRTGELIAHRIGVRRFILTEDVVKWIRNHRKW